MKTQDKIRLIKSIARDLANNRITEETYLAHMEKILRGIDPYADPHPEGTIAFLVLPAGGPDWGVHQFPDRTCLSLWILHAGRWERIVRVDQYKSKISFGSFAALVNTASRNKGQLVVTTPEFYLEGPSLDGFVDNFTDGAREFHNAPIGTEPVRDRTGVWWHFNRDKDLWSPAADTVWTEGKPILKYSLTWAELVDHYGPIGRERPKYDSEIDPSGPHEPRGFA